MNNEITDGKGNCKTCGGHFGHSRMCPHFTGYTKSVEAGNPASATAAGTIDTPEFRDLLGRVWNSPTIGLRDKRAKPLIAHLNQRIAALRAECASVIEEHVTELRAATARIAELERAATAPVSAVPDVLEALETLYHALPDILPSGAYQRFLNTGKWAAGNAYADRGIMARLEYRADDMETVYAAMDQARASLPPSAGAPVSGAQAGPGYGTPGSVVWGKGGQAAPVSGAEQAGAAQNEANSPQTRMDAQSKLLLDTSAGGQELPALPEPDVIGYTCIGDNDAYSPAKLREHGKVCARAALEWAASICDEMTAHWASYKDTALLNGDVELSNAASGEPRAGEFLATAIRALAAKQAGKEG